MVSISFIIPIYNVEQYVQRCLESVMAQDGVDADMECLIIDDCTPDRSIDIAHKVVESYNGSIQFRFIHHESNLGLSAARNTGIREAKGDFICFIDSDDYLMPDSISYFLTNLNLHPEVDMVVGNVRNCKSGDLQIHHVQEPLLMCNPDDFFLDMLRHRIYLYAWNKLIRRQVLIDNNIFFIEGIIYEDQSWSYQLFSHIKSVLLLPKVTYAYEYNQNSIVNSMMTKAKADKVLSSYTVSTRYTLGNPPNPCRYVNNVTVDYVLFMANFLMNGVDLQAKSEISPNVAKDFRAVRQAMLNLALRDGRFLLFCFLLLLFPPLSHLQRFRFFRHHYYELEAVVNRLCHLTDFLHRKDKI